MKKPTITLDPLAQEPLHGGPVSKGLSPLYCQEDEDPGTPTGLLVSILVSTDIPLHQVDSMVISNPDWSLEREDE